jgi:hypothetical protein
MDLIFRIIIPRRKIVTSIHVSFTHFNCIVPPQSPLEAPQPQNI